MFKENKYSNFLSWFNRIRTLNRRMLIHSSSAKVREIRPPFTQYLRILASRCFRRPVRASWIRATNALGAIYAHRSLGSSEDMEALRTFLDQHIDAQGTWKITPRGVDDAMKGYSFLYLAEVTGEARYRNAAHWLTDYLITTYPKASDGSLLYFPSVDIVLVDMLGMVCPFLTRYGSLYGHSASLEMSACQVLQFIQQNVDADTHLPYHGYYPNGPKRLGMQGWGRGTGWYMLGLVDTLVDLPKYHPASSTILDAYQMCAAALRKFQRPDGHWSWAIPLRKAPYDSSATAFLGYSLMRGLQAGLLDPSYFKVIKSAIEALMAVTSPNGLLDGSMAECLGVGLYPAVFGPQPWLQGMACALAALWAQYVEKDLPALQDRV